MSFNITLARPYKWQTENYVDQRAFVHALIELFQSLIGGQLHLVGVSDGEHGKWESGAYVYLVPRGPFPVAFLSQYSHCREKNAYTNCHARTRTDTLIPVFYCLSPPQSILSSCFALRLTTRSSGTCRGYPNRCWSPPTISVQCAPSRPGPSIWWIEA